MSDGGAQVHRRDDGYVELVKTPEKFIDTQRQLQNSRS
jgi:hypothetical protein